MGSDAVGSTIGHVIQYAVSPVFLLLGIGTMLGVMTNRLARVVDRARALEARRRDPAEPGDGLARQLETLLKRAQNVNRAIALCTLTALLVCALIATLFIGALLRYDAGVPVAILFIGAMTSFFSALVCFLREVFLATAGLRVGLGK